MRKIFLAILILLVSITVSFAGSSPSIEDYTTIESMSNGVPVYSFSNIMYVYGQSPDFFPDIVRIVVLTWFSQIISGAVAGILTIGIIKIAFKTQNIGLFFFALRLQRYCLTVLLLP